MKLFSKKSIVRSCNVYVESNRGRFIVAPCFDHGGLFMEMPGKTRVVEGGSEEMLGTSIQKALTESVFQSKFNYRDYKKSDWPAFKVSGEKTIKGFEEKFLALRVIEGESVYTSSAVDIFRGDVSSKVKKGYGITLSMLISRHASPGELGKEILYLAKEVDLYSRLK